MDKLSKYITQVRGVTYNPKDIAELPLEDYLPILKANNIKEDGLDTSELIYIHKSKIKEEQLIRKGDLLLAASSGSKDIVGKNVFFESDFHGSFGAFCKVVRPNENIYPKFLSAFFKTPTYKRHIRKLIQGANINNLRNEDIDSLRIPQFTTNEQIQIADLLSKTDDLLNLRKESLLLLDKFLTSTFFEMFGDTMNGATDKLGDYLKLYGGGAFKSTDFIDEGIPVIKIGTVNKGFFDTSTFSFLPESFEKTFSKYIVRPGDLLLSLTGTVGKDDYGNTCFANNSRDFYFLNQRVAKIVVDAKHLNINFINYLFKYPKFKTNLIRANRGVRQANLSNDDIYNLRVKLPAIELQDEFALIIEKAEALRVDYQNSLHELENLYGSLSQQAFRGELEIIGMGLLPGKAEIEINISVEIPQVPVESKSSKEKTKVDKLSTYETLFPFIGKVIGREAKLEDIQLLIKKHFKDDYFVYEDLKKVFINMGFPYDFEKLKDFVFELLRQGQLKQVFADATFKSTFKEADADADRVKELTEQMYLQKTDGI